MNEKFGEIWEIITSLKFPDGPTIHEHNGTVELTIIKDGVEVVNCEIGKTNDVIFNENGIHRTPFEMIMEVDKIAFIESGIELEFEEYMIDDILVAIFKDSEGMTREEFLEKEERERIEEALMNSDVD